MYRGDADRRRFLEQLAGCVGIHHIRLYSYVLMSNHLRLLSETPRANLAPFMQQINSSYSIYVNCRHGRSGHLIGGRYKAEPGLRDGSGVSRALRQLHGRLVSDRALRQQLRTCRERLTYIH